jgi:uncharacterized protein
VGEETDPQPSNGAATALDSTSDPIDAAPGPEELAPAIPPTGGHPPAAGRTPPGYAVVPLARPGEFHRLDPRVIRLDRIGGWIVTACVSVPTFFASPILLYPARKPLVALLVFIGWVTVTAALAWLAHYWPPIDYRHTSYRIDPQSLEIRRGVVWRTVITVPRSRVQHIDVSQGPLERSHGLATLTVYTAGTEHSQVALKGVAHETAIAIRDHVLPGPDDDGV